jgi:exosortase
MTPNRAHAGRFAWLMAACVAVLLLLWPGSRALAALWLDGARTTYTHGFLVAAVAAWLLWRRVAGGAGFLQSWNRGQRIRLAALLLLSVFLWQLFYRAGISAAHLLLLPVIIGLAVAAAFGPAALRAARLPLIFLVFALPVWDYLNPLVLYASIHLVRLLLRMFSVPAYFEEHLVQIPDGVFAIEGGCSGLHYVIVALALATLIGELRGDTWRLRLRWLLLALALALIANWIRVFSIIAIGHATHMQHYLIRESHYGYGWLLFALAIVVMFVIESRTPQASPPRATAGDAAPGSTGPTPRVAWAFAVVAILALPLAINLLIDRASSHEVRLAAVAPGVNGWEVEPTEAPGWQPQMPGADEHHLWAYSAGGNRVLLYIALYREQRDGKEFAGYANRPEGPALSDGASPENLVTSGYRVAGRSFVDAVAAQLWYSWRTLLSLRSQPALVWVARTRCVRDCGSARETLSRFTPNQETLDAMLIH